MRVFAAADPYDDLANQLAEPDSGFSINPLTGAVPSKRYMVAIEGNEQDLQPNEVTAQALRNHAQKISSLLSDPDTFHGAWHDPKSHHVYLDVAKQYDDPNEAMNQGKKNNQLAIYDNVKGASIPVPGTKHGSHTKPFFIRISFIDFVRTAAQVGTAAHPALDSVKQSWVAKSGAGPSPAPRNAQQGMQEADHYASHPHDPTNPKMQQSYQSLIGAVGAQYNDLRKAGLSYTPHTGAGEPYANSNEMRADLAKGNLKYLPTGTAGDLPAGHPMAQTIPTVDGPMMANDAFRAVHDSLGHGWGASFGPVGEQQAWRNHRETLPPDAHAALWSETRGQNTDTNYGQHMRDASGNLLPPEQQPGLADRPFAEQKIVDPGEYA